MVMYVLCPSCSYPIGDIHMFLELCKIKHNRDQLKDGAVAEEYASRPGKLKDIGYILDAGGLFRECCRMRVISTTQYDQMKYKST